MNEAQALSSFWKKENSSVPDNILEFSHSFGYDCKRLFNLCIIDEDTLSFASGNLIHYYHIKSSEVTFRRSVGGGGIGFILVNTIPTYNHLTVLENGEKPVVYIYHYPSHRIVSTLRDGAHKSFTTAAYSCDGELLATQAGYPDYMLTIWNWKKATIILRSQSFQNDVLNIVFSPHNPILLSTCGLGHTKFWKMAQSFTGLKLQGDLGRFGKTEISDIYALYMLPDEKVISGCAWGNMLVWEAGLIKLEVCRKGRRPCHEGPITQITMTNGEVMTVAMDGFIRIWFWETVELADLPDDDRFVEIEPIFEFRIGTKDETCECLHLLKIDSKEDSYTYYAQDGQGGIWWCDINPEVDPIPARKIFSCHGGKVVAGDASPATTHIATLGEDHRLNVYNYKTHSLVLQKFFSSPGTDLLWLPPTIEPTGLVLILAFADGVIRQIVLEFEQRPSPRVHLIDAIKSHSKKITKITVNTQGDLLVSGSEDNTIFLYSLQKNDYIRITPIGFVTVHMVPSVFYWHLKNAYSILMGSSSGDVVKATLPHLPPKDDTRITLRLDDVALQKTQFVSVKSDIRRKIKQEETKKRKEAKRQKKMEEMEKLKQANPGIQIDEENALADSEEEEEEPPLYIPKMPNAVLWLRYTPKDTVLAAMGGYDSGYLYEMDFDHERPVRSRMVEDADDLEIHCYLYVGKHLVFGMQNGVIRVNATKDDYTDLSDYWTLSMHDNLNGIISKVFLSHDSKHIFSIGRDGNIFSYTWHGDVVQMPKVSRKFSTPKVVEDIDDATQPSLEDEMIEAEQNRQAHIAEEKSKKTFAEIAKLRAEYEEILKINESLPASQRLTAKQLQVDPRITEALINIEQEKLDLVRRKLAFDVEKARLGKEKLMKYYIEPLQDFPFSVNGIRKSITVKSFRVKKLDDRMEEAKADVEERIRKREAEKHCEDKEVVESETVALVETDASEEVSIPNLPEETFFLGLNSEEIIPKFSKQMMRLLHGYRQRQVHRIDREVEWKILQRRRPDQNQIHVDDIKAIEEAKKSIGDYKLKTDPDYEPSSSENLLDKYKEVLEARERLFNIKQDYNLKLLKLRQDKKDLYDYVQEQTEAMAKLHQFIPANARRNFEAFPLIDRDKEYPEELFAEELRPGYGLDIKDIAFDERPLEEILDEVLACKKEAPPEEEEFVDPRDTDEFKAGILDVASVETMPPMDEVLEMLANLPKVETIADMKKYAGRIDSPVAIQLRYDFIFDKIIKQNAIIDAVKLRAERFDEALDELAESRLQTQLDAKFLELHQVRLNQELIILKDSESLEKDLLDKTFAALTERNAVQANMNALTKQIDDLRRSVERANEQIKVIQGNFLVMVKGNKFFDFLKRIFKKKFRPPKQHFADESDESSESDESTTDEEDDGKSVESLDIAPIRLDEGYCPPGCDRKLYDSTLQMRADRQALEQAVHNHLQVSDEKKRLLESLKSKLHEAEDRHFQEKGNLMEFRRKKQKVLNEVETTVVLPMSQIKHVEEGGDFNDLSQAILFDTESITKLYDRVEELSAETLETKRRHRVNVVHLQRLTTDCKFMQKQIKELNEDIEKVMIRKFGMVVDLDKLEEDTLRKYVFDIQTDMAEEQKDMERKIAHKKKMLASVQKELIRKTQENTQALNILTVLQEEKNLLTLALEQQEINMEKWNNTKQIDFSKELDRVMHLNKVQDEQIQCLEREIRTLRLKSKPFEVMEKPEVDVSDVCGAAAVKDDDCADLSYMLQMPIDEYTLSKVIRIVQRFFIKHFTKLMKDDDIRKYSEKVAKYLGYVVGRFGSEHSDKVMECVLEHLQTIVPKKYLILVTSEDIQGLLTEIAAASDYEQSTVSTEELVSSIVINSVDAAQGVKTRNPSQHILVDIFKELIFALSLEEFECEATERTLVEMLSLDKFDIIPICLCLDELVDEVCKYAQESLIDEITKTPIRRLAKRIIAALTKNKKK